MNELEQYVQWVISRVDQDETPFEEADFEIKAQYDERFSGPKGPWEIADLIASLANDVRINGLRSLVFGPSPSLERPVWLADESRLRDKLIRHFDGGVLPSVELIRRELPERGMIDVFVIVERQSPPYVTRVEPGGSWVVRVRTNTARRTATRDELIGLVRGRQSGIPVRRLDVRVAPWGRGTRKLMVTNAGTVPVRKIRLKLPEGAKTQALPNYSSEIELLNPGERDSIGLFVPTEGMGRTHNSERITVEGLADDGETVSASVIVSDFD